MSETPRASQPATRHAGVSDGSLVVRRAEPGEYDAVGQLTVAGYVHDGFLTPGDDYAEELRDAASRAATAELWVAERAGELVGTVTFCPPGSALRELGTDDAGEFRMLAVAPHWRGRGVARTLVALCLERCRELGLSEVVLCSMTTMTSAHALYGSFGFLRDESLDWRPRPDVLLVGFRAVV